jgi:hypothetical protein
MRYGVVAVHDRGGLFAAIGVWVVLSVAAMPTTERRRM